MVDNCNIKTHQPKKWTRLIFQVGFWLTRQSKTDPIFYTFNKQTVFRSILGRTEPDSSTRIDTPGFPPHIMKFGLTID